jgi:hypothetical protein
MVKSAKAATRKVLKSEAPLDNSPPLADRESFHYHLGQIEQKQAIVASARKVLKEARRKAQDAGVTLKDLDHIMKMRDEEPETVQAGIKRLATYAYWAGLAPGVQLDMFEVASAALSAEKAAEDEGYIDGLEGKTAEGDRYDMTTKTGQARMKGWNRGQAVVHDRFIQKSEAAVATH